MCSGLAGPGTARAAGPGGIDVSAEIDAALAEVDAVVPQPPARQEQSVTLNVAGATTVNVPAPPAAEIVETEVAAVTQPVVHGGVRSNYDDARESGERAGGAAASRAGAKAWRGQGFRPAEATAAGRWGRVAHHTRQQRPEHDGRRRYFASDARHPRGAKSAPSPCSCAAQSTGGSCAAAAPAGTTASSPGHDLVRTRGRPGVGPAASACGARSSAGVFHAVTLASGPSATGLPEAEANRPSSLASGLTSFSGLHARRSATARRPNHNYGEGEGDESQAIERGRGTGCPGRRSSPGVR